MSFYFHVRTFLLVFFFLFALTCFCHCIMIYSMQVVFGNSLCESPMVLFLICFVLICFVCSFFIYIASFFSRPRVRITCSLPHATLSTSRWECRCCRSIRTIHALLVALRLLRMSRRDAWMTAWTAMSWRRLLCICTYSSMR